MIRFCIVLSVFLVTVIFGMADMEMRSQYIQAVKTDGNWHAAFHVDKRDGALLGMRPEVEEIAAYGAVNYRLKDGYEIQGVETCICGLEEEFLSMFPDVSILEGNFPKDEEEAVLNVTAKRRLGLSVGDSSDWDGCDTIDALPSIDKLGCFYEYLLHHGYHETVVRDLFYNNLMRVVSQR